MSDVAIFLGDGLIPSDVGMVNLQPTKKTHRVAYTNENFFDSYSCSPPQKLSGFIINQNGFCLHSEYNIHGLTSKKYSFCAA